jgi:hypothetical protein
MGFKYGLLLAGIRTQKKENYNEENEHNSGSCGVGDKFELGGRAAGDEDGHGDS